jgi:hypothetical protein
MNIVLEEPGAPYQPAGQVVTSRGAIVLDRGADGTLETNAHEQINRLLADLAQIEASSCRFDVLITKLICAVRNEVRHEEVEVFPWPACCAGEQTLIAIGDQVQAFQDTRP